MPPPVLKATLQPLDLLSILPPVIIQNILCRLPIREAIQTCVLSRRWRYKWCSMTRLKFSDDCVKLRADDDDASFDRIFVNFVDRVLLHHQGPVHEITIATKAKPCLADLNQWVHFASWNEVRELSLQFLTGSNVEAPSSLFLCSKLTSLHLSACKVRELPVGFKGFMFLKTLRFYYGEIPCSSLQKLISSCAILESLEIRECHPKALDVYAPLLKRLHLEGEVAEYYLEETPLLRELKVMICSDVCNVALVKYLNCIPSVEKLTCSSYFLKGWSQAASPSMGTVTYNHLRFIELDVNFEDPAVVAQLLKLMIRSPVLENVCIVPPIRRKLREVAMDSQFWCEARGVGRKFSRLKDVRITTRGSANEREFMKLVLANSPTLVKMMVNFGCCSEDKRKIAKEELSRCHWESREIEVVFTTFL
ncbi:hypothetical protein MLD38_011453 [Melastoma candidum]|uniref:Uncharacterized protein n=1 Tax=Melastoma candidum TaxID=119954 RepID=A0ACB9R2Q5_9MYRT|nr:hypothetical protein MLD38_011453 [Melastoma candidum]